MDKLKNKTFLVTGATGYLGSSISEEISKHGGNLILVSRNLKKLKLLKKNLEINFDNFIEIFECNLLNLNKVKKLVKTINSKKKSLNGIINCAYSGKTGSIKSISSNDFTNATNLNMTSPFFLIKNLKKLLENSAKKSKQTSSIVNISSIYGIVSPEDKNYSNSNNVNPIHYGVSKSGMIQLSKYLACNLSRKYIRVNSISPGAVPNLKNKKKKEFSKLKSRIPLGRFGKPSEIAKCIIFLISNDSSYITGTNLVADGGWTSW